MQSPPASSDNAPSKRPMYHTETTGSWWGDTKEAVKIQCARSSLLSGIASGAGIGVIRGMSSGPLIASNWAVGTFMLVSLGTWTICRKAMEDERRRVQVMVESLPRKLAERSEKEAQADGKA
ncbi:uncharacterized protein PHACADRAFT_177079 [Phanerochaete carnosa HHB-10118-sp]|uniref:Cytochrome c oxidase assembly protein COX20, mitochondrial n=1 Tax=Phanerochaete carnosa (strain HHB-10118-sp) TaxID=650164 RepID=K5VYH2_PHACS|nr:uncharacterized protein PHACADRAFT_177079 [Phanerochaete carnosa HHB-10118-sp]EKM51659.1 hypothetical protein PHACADRAFT_177079 [Phanerochaete carnosa HHB-10118-sp]